ncbi:MAG: hypothetical protein Q8Q59_03315 [Luteolibacter sp.]|nr:hypothetical protein [Luteolibacter sp.]
MGFPSGLSIWALGQFPKRGESSEYYEDGKKSGPYKGRSQMPPSISMHREGEREPGSRGRLAVRHQFLDVARYRIRPYRKKKKVAPVCWDRLRNFRELVWYLVLAGYSPSYIRTFFLTEIPNVFPTLSYWGVRFSVEKAYERAFAGELILDDEFRDALQDFRAGPWAKNAPGWLREQYGVPLEEPKSGGKDSLKGKGKDSGKDVVGESVGEKTPEEIQRGIVFWDSWIKYSSSRSGIPDPTPEEIVLGEAQGISAVLIRRQAAGVSVGTVTGEVSVSPVVGSGVVSPAVAAVSAGPGGADVSVVGSESEKSARFLEEVALVELARGGPLNLSSAETMEAYAVGLGEFLKKRQVSGGSGSSGGSGLAGSTVVPAVKEPVVPGVSGNDSGESSVGDGKPVDSHGVDSAVAKESGDLVSPVEPGKELGSDGSDGVGGVLEPVSADALIEVPDVPVVSGGTLSAETVATIVPEVVEPPKEKKVWRRPPSPLDPVPDSECLRHGALGIAVGVRDVPGMDPFNIGGVPRVWKLDLEIFGRSKVEPSDFYKSLGDAAPYLVEHVQDTKYAPWVVTGDHGLGIYSRFGGMNPVEMVDPIKMTFPSYFPKLSAAPRTQKEAYEMPLEQAKACFDEWVLVESKETPELPCPFAGQDSMTMLAPTPILMDLLDRGMGPGFWGVHESFLIHWMMGLVMRELFGFPTVWGHQGGQRYIPMAAVPSLENGIAAIAAKLDYFRPWRSTSPLFIETLAPRCESENLPGHIWVTGLGYLPESAFGKIREYAGPACENHPDFDDVSRDVKHLLHHWCRDIMARVDGRRYSSNPSIPEMGHYFENFWNVNSSKVFLLVDGGRMQCSPLFCATGSIATRFGMRNIEWFTESVMGVPGAQSSYWDVADGFLVFEKELSKIRIAAHMPSLYAVGTYLQFLEARRPRSSDGGAFIGMKFPESMLRPDHEVPYPPVFEDKPFRPRFKVALGKGRDYV